MPRACLLVLDSLGIGAAPDAANYGDAAANTLGNIALACEAGLAEHSGGVRVRSGSLKIPNLLALGLGLACTQASGLETPALAGGGTRGLHGCAAERSLGKDTPSGHWEMTGVPVLQAWRTFPDTVPALPPQFTAALIAQGNIPGLLGNCHASGTQIIKNLGEAHLASGKPVIYTSTDSVIQIAAHETSFGLERLYALCALARTLADPLGVARIIARPFAGKAARDFARTPNRRDYAVPPPAPTILDLAVEEGCEVIAIGKIADIFSGRGISRTIRAAGNEALLAETVSALETAPDRSLIITNLVDFDQLYGHRRDVAGYAAALEAFDRRLPQLLAALHADDLLVITADHGCDPTAPGTEHTREYVPVLAFGPAIAAGGIGARASFADIGASIASHLALPWSGAGSAFL